MKVTILDGNGNRKERALSGKATIERVIEGPERHLKVTVAKSRVDRVQRWLTDALSTIQTWEDEGYVWFDVTDASRDSTTVPFWSERRYKSVGAVLDNRTIVHVKANQPRQGRRVAA